MEGIEGEQKMNNTFVVLLRGINVSGQRTIRMAELRERLQAMGFEAVRTYLQSGNVILQSNEQDVECLAARIRAMIQSDFGHEVQVLVLAERSLREMVESNPLAPVGAEDGNLYHATLLFGVVANAALERLTLPLQVGERAQLVGRTIYLYCPGGYGKTKLNNSYFERKLSIPATTRNWRSILAILEMCA